VSPAIRKLSAAAAHAWTPNPALERTRTNVALARLLDWYIIHLVGQAPCRRSSNSFTCPAGGLLRSTGAIYSVGKGLRREDFKAQPRDCTACALRSCCLRPRCAAMEIVTALRAGPDSDLKFWNDAARHAHRVDLPVVEEFVAAKRHLLESMTRSLPPTESNAAQAVAQFDAQRFPDTVIRRPHEPLEFVRSVPTSHGP
jgi:hypothetical protein